MVLDEENDAPCVRVYMTAPVTFSSTVDPECFFKILHPLFLTLGAEQTQPTKTFCKSSKMYRLRLTNAYLMYALFSMETKNSERNTVIHVAWRKTFKNGSWALVWVNE
jgi:hypothetical protein